jgi:hypothetical protein
MRCLATEAASTHHIDGKPGRAAVAWRTFLAAFLALPEVHAGVLFDYTKNKLRLDLTLKKVNHRQGAESAVNCGYNDETSFLQ